MRAIPGTITEHPAMAAAREAGVLAAEQRLDPENPAHRRILSANDRDAERQARFSGARIDTTTGLHGRLIAWAASDPEADFGMVSGWAIVRRDNAPVEERPYSLHYVYWHTAVGDVAAESGIYDLTLAEARHRFARLTGLAQEVAA